MTAQKPLPVRMRPDDPDHFLGQSHLAGRLRSLMAAERLPTGGTAMYALLALAGDMGCSAGPGLVGLAAGRVGLRTGLLFALVFPVTLLLALGAGRKKSA